MQKLQKKAYHDSFAIHAEVHLIPAGVYLHIQSALWVNELYTARTI